MDKKEAYTRTFLIAAGQEVTKEAVDKHHILWWQNIRSKGDSGLRLTQEGFEFCKDQADLESYEIQFPQSIKFTPQVFLYLDQFIDCPYYVTSKRIYVLSEKMALNLMMFAGDIKQYGLARAMARELEES